MAVGFRLSHSHQAGKARVQGLGAQDFGLRVLGLGVSRFWVLGVQDFGLRVLGLEF